MVQICLAFSSEKIEAINCYGSRDQIILITLLYFLIITFYLAFDLYTYTNQTKPEIPFLMPKT